MNGLAMCDMVWISRFVLDNYRMVFTGDVNFPRRYLPCKTVVMRVGFGSIGEVAKELIASFIFIRKWKT